MKPADAAPKPPVALGSFGRALWRDVLEAFELHDPHHRAILAEACRVRDEIERTVETIAAEGEYVADRFQQRRAHPAVAVLRDQRALLAKLLRELGLDGAAAAESRPPALRGRYVARP